MVCKSEDRVVGIFTLGQAATALGENECVLIEFLYRRRVLRMKGLPLLPYVPKYFIIREHLVTDTMKRPYIERYTGVTPDGLALIRKIRAGESVDVGEDGAEETYMRAA